MTSHTVSANERNGRWTARCKCGWWRAATGQENARLLMLDHDRAAKARAKLRCNSGCYDPVSMEYDPAGVCDVCEAVQILDGLLGAA